jgi:orotidine-5'-phosphate decarboxylase
MKRLIVALDTPELTQAKRWAEQVAASAGLLKVGLEYFLAHGQAGYRAIDGTPIFLDLKLHDIPNTVAGAVRSVLGLGPKMLTVHAAGGPTMIAAAREAASRSATPPMILAVTVLTSMDAAALRAVGVERNPEDQVLKLATMAVEAGADGIVCSALEVALLRQHLPASVKLVVPGIRPAGAGRDDQARTMTPHEAVAAGADYIVVGRPITAAFDPSKAAADIASEIA